MYIWSKLVIPPSFILCLWPQVLGGNKATQLVLPPRHAWNTSLPVLFYPLCCPSMWLARGKAGKTMNRDTISGFKGNNLILALTNHAYCNITLSQTQKIGSGLQVECSSHTVCWWVDEVFKKILNGWIVMQMHRKMSAGKYFIGWMQHNTFDS